MAGALCGQPLSLGPWGKARVRVLTQTLWPRCLLQGWDGAEPRQQDLPPPRCPWLVLTRDRGILLSSDGGTSWKGSPQVPL